MQQLSKETFRFVFSFCVACGSREKKSEPLLCNFFIFVFALPSFWSQQVYNSVLAWILNLILYLASKFLDPVRTARVIKDGVGTAWTDGNIFKRDPKSGDFPRFRMTVLISA